MKKNCATVSLLAVVGALVLVALYHGRADAMFGTLGSEVMRFPRTYEAAETPRALIESPAKRRALSEDETSTKDDSGSEGSDDKKKASDASKREGSSKQKEVVSDKEDEDGDSSEEKHVPVYDHKGFHLGPPDFIGKALKPEELQPFYAMPVFFGLKLTLTMLVFGFSLKFKKQNPNIFCDTLKAIGKFVSGLAFIALGINGYMHDYTKFVHASRDVDDSRKRIAIFFIIWVTSSNYVACRAVWSSLKIENPGDLLEIEPTYTNIPIVNIPLCPGGAKWLHPLRHIYALLLLPYFLPNLVSQLCLSCVLAVWCCSTKCAVCFMSIWASCSCNCALIGTIITLGFWAWAKDALAYWWPLIQPVYYQVFIQYWAQFICPALFACIYNIFLGGSTTDLLGGLAPSGAGATDPLAAATGKQFQLDKDDIEKLKKLNSKTLIDNFSGMESASFAPVSTGEQQGDAEQNVDDSGLEDSKVKIFSATLRNMSSIVLEQLGLIFFIRAICGQADYDHYMAAMVRTMTERTWVKYTGHLHRLTTMKYNDAVSSIYAAAADSLWRLI